MSEFNENLRRIRKEKGFTQEQLADSVGVSAQAVSKWEQQGYPDPAVLPQIADFLDVTIDELYGREIEPEKSIFVRIMEYIHSLDGEERIQAIYELSRTAMIATVGECEYRPIPPAILDAVDWESHTQIEFESGFALARLNKSLQFALVMPQPEKGYDDILRYDDEYTRLFSAFSDKDVLRAVYCLDKKGGGTLFTAKALSRQLSVSLEKAQEIVEKLLSLDIIWRANLDDGKDEYGDIYQYKIRGLYLVAFLTFARMLLHKPYSFNYQTNSRNKQYLTGDSYKRNSDNEKKK